jgi:hypothetical protein
MGQYSFRFFLIFILILLFGGCGAAKVKVHQSPLFSSYPLSVAILPFTTEKDGEFLEKGIEKVLRDVFYNYFSYLSFSDLPLEKIDKILAENKLENVSYSKKLPLKKLRDVLGVDAVIQGKLINSNNFTAGIYAETWLKAQMQLIDLQTGETLWDLDHEELDQSSLATPTIVDMVRQQIANSDTEKAYYKLAEQFASKVVRKIPDPNKIAQNQIKSPKISGIFANIESNRKLNIGDIIEVTLTGSPKLTASFDIGSWKFSIPLKETQPGLYTGAYSVQPRDHFQNALIIGRLKDRLGITGKKALHGVTLSTSKTPIQKANLNLPDNAKKFKN